LNKTEKNSFYKNVVTLIKGNSIAQAIPLIISPILARIYSPENFADFGVYMSILAILTVFVTGKYELAIMLPKKDNNALNIFALSIIITIIVSIITLLITINPFFNLVDLLSLTIDKNLIFYFPLSILLIGVFNSFYYLNNRSKQFHELAQTKVYRSSSTAIFNISFGAIGLTSFGLIASNIIAQLIANINLFRHNMVLKSVCSSVNVVTMKKMLFKYRKFPVFDLPANLFFNLYSSMLVLYFSIFMTPTIAGMYFFVNRLLKTPASFFVTSFQDVFFQKISEDSNNIGFEVEKFSKQIFFYLCLPFFSIIYLSYFYSDLLFGNQWTGLYKYFYCISLPIFISIINSPFAHVLKVLNKQEYSLMLHVGRFIILLTALYLMSSWNFKLFEILIIFSLLESIYFLLSSIFIMKILNYSYSFYLKLVIFSLFISFLNLFLLS
tara:strand:- start:3377 stop:4693 length:1317 start_codon:yes stop_codon:yes gene_type:complete